MGFTDPVMVSLAVGLIMGAIPGIEPMLFAPDAPLRSFFDALLQFGYVGVKMPLIFLGANLFFYRNLKLPFSRRYIISIMACKLVIAPIFLLIYFAVLKEFTNIGENMPLAYVAFLAAAGPSAQLLTATTQMYDVAVNEISVLFLYVYLASVPSIIVSSYIFFLIMM
jgi:hypothetical protein